MVMETLQVRLSPGLIEKIDRLVKTQMYSSRSDVMRDAVRRLVIDNLVGILPDTGDSVKEVRKIRKRLSKEKVNLKKINKLAD